MAITAVHPRCPYAVRGADSPDMQACPGYEPEVVPIGAERIVGCGNSCRHLGSQRDPARRGGYISACTHPLLGVPAAPSPETASSNNGLTPAG